MSILRFKTRSNTNPQGKPKVYFCAPPEDYSKYFDIITNEILSKQNCSVWYLDDANATRSEDLLIDLEQMQLFVMPVTTNLLCTANDALDVDFKFAIEHHIPVLPLMQEPGLEELFNKKCGELQFLDKNKIDETAISYEEKLEKYLSSVLIGDELAEKIRAAFDAYVFLSYRKKDRKYAQELMRLIHKNDFCRDIAIWYDEFLTPGENFNDSIKDALEKSGLFVLAVTPNLVNETNYIMTTEYPMAREEGKPILPAELVPTDREQLFEKYKDIPTPANAHDDVELSEALLESIKKMAIKENDASPEHNFFIGLAYLGGVDVEVDFNRAHSLILNAAESGLKEAHEMLVSMYKNGRGVERSFAEAIKWQRRLADLCYDEYSTEPNEDTITAVHYAYMNLGDLCREFNVLEEAEEAYENMLSAARSLDSQIRSFSSREQLVNSLNRIAIIKKERGDYKSFNQLLLEVVEIDEEIYDDTNWLKAIHLSNLGLSCYFLQEYTNAQKHYERAIEVINASDFDSNDFLVTKSKVYNNYGLNFEVLTQYEQAKQQYKKAIDLIESLNQNSDGAFIEEYGLYISNIASAHLSTKDYELALHYLMTGRDAVEKKYCENQSNRLISIVAVLENLIGRVYSEQKKNKLAEVHYKESLKWYLIWDGEFAELYQSEIALVHNNIGVLYLSKMRYKKAAEELKKAYEAFVKLSHGEKTYRRMRALSGYNLGLALISKFRFKKALPYMLDSYNMYTELVTEGMEFCVEMRKKALQQLVGIYFITGHPIKAFKLL